MENGAETVREASTKCLGIIKNQWKIKWKLGVRLAMPIRMVMAICQSPRSNDQLFETRNRELHQPPLWPRLQRAPQG